MKVTWFSHLSLDILFQEQYQFIFDALVEYFVIGNTAIAADELPAQVATLKSTSSSGAKSLLQEQYEVCA